jgi:hypothetical protein
MSNKKVKVIKLGRDSPEEKEINLNIPNSAIIVFPDTLLEPDEVFNKLNSYLNSNTFFLFIFTEFPRRKIGEKYPYEAFNLILNHYPSTFIKFPEEIEKIRNLSQSKKASLEWEKIKALWLDLKGAMEGVNTGQTTTTDDQKIYEELNKGFTSEEERIKREHGLLAQSLVPRKEDDIFKFYMSLDFAFLLSHYEGIKSLKKNILVVDDKLEPLKKIFEILQEKVCPSLVFFCTEHLPENNEEIQVEIVGELSANNNNEIEIDIVLLDLFFSQGEKTGFDFLQTLQAEKSPIKAKDINGRTYNLKIGKSSSIFILSKSLDIVNYEKARRMGADRYIPKHRLIALPYFIYDYYHREIGSFVEKIEENRRRKFIGYLRLWRKQKDLLYMNTKTPHIVDHTYQHAENLWKLLNQLNDSCEIKFAVNNLPFIAACSLWLHDIGHKGYEAEVKASYVREMHSLISGKHIIEHPDVYLPEFEDKEILNKTSLVCAYHIKKVPLDEMGKQKLADLDINLLFVRSPDDFRFLKVDSEKHPISLSCYEDGTDLCKATALLRFLDAIDIQENRVGKRETSIERIYNCWFEAKYYLEELSEEKKNIENKLGSLRYLQKKGAILREMENYYADFKEWVKDKEAENGFYKLAVKVIDRNEEGIRAYEKKLDEMERRKREIVARLKEVFSPELWEEWDSIAEHIIYLTKQPHHYLKHTTFSKVEIRKDKDNDEKVNICYFLPHTDESLVKIALEQCILSYEDIMKEYILISEYLKDFPFDSVVFYETSPDVPENMWLRLPFPQISQNSPPFAIYVAWNINYKERKVAQESDKLIKYFHNDDRSEIWLLPDEEYALVITGKNIDDILGEKLKGEMKDLCYNNISEVKKEELWEKVKVCGVEWARWEIKYGGREMKEKIEKSLKKEGEK